MAVQAGAKGSSVVLAKDRDDVRKSPRMKRNVKVVVPDDTSDEDELEVISKKLQKRKNTYRDSTKGSEVNIKVEVPDDEPDKDEPLVIPKKLLKLERNKVKAGDDGCNHEDSMAPSDGSHELNIKVEAPDDELDEDNKSNECPKREEKSIYKANEIDDVDSTGSDSMHELKIKLETSDDDADLDEEEYKPKVTPRPNREKSVYKMNEMIDECTDGDSTGSDGMRELSIKIEVPDDDVNEEYKPELIPKKRQKRKNSPRKINKVDDECAYEDSSGSEGPHKLTIKIEDSDDDLDEDYKPKVIPKKRSRLKRKRRTYVRKKVVVDECASEDSDRSKSTTEVGLKEKPHTCEICLRSYVYALNLERHMRSHKGPEQVHRCDVCSRNMGSAESLKEHKRKHSIPRTRCFYCKLHFDSTEELNRHQALNKCIKKHNCNSCSQQFIREYDLEQHQKACHGTIVRPLLSSIDCGMSDNLVVKTVCRTYSRKKNVDAPLAAKGEDKAVKTE